MVLACLDHAREFRLEGSTVADYFPYRIQVRLRDRIDLSAVTFLVSGEPGQTSDCIETIVPRPGMANEGAALVWQWQFSGMFYSIRRPICGETFMAVARMTR